MNTELSGEDVLKVMAKGVWWAAESIAGHLDFDSVLAPEVLGRAAPRGRGSSREKAVQGYLVYLQPLLEQMVQQGLLETKMNGETPWYRNPARSPTAVGSPARVAEAVPAPPASVSSQPTKPTVAVAKAASTADATNGHSANSGTSSEAIPCHPVTNIYPLMQGVEFEGFKEDIRANGLRVPIYTHRGQIIDGRNRYRACREVDIEPRFQEWDGKGSLIAFVVSLNERRRHLTESQRAMAAAKAKEMFEEEARERMLAGRVADPPLHAEEGRKGEAAAQAAELFHVGKDSVYKAQKVLDKGVQELQQAVEAGRLSVSAAADVAELSEKEQAEAVAAGDDKVLAKAKEVRSAKKSTKSRKSSGATKQAVPVPTTITTASTKESMAASPTTITVPVEPIPLAQAIVEQLGMKLARRVHTELGRLLLT